MQAEVSQHQLPVKIASFSDLGKKLLYLCKYQVSRTIQI